MNKTQETAPGAHAKASRKPRNSINGRGRRAAQRARRILAGDGWTAAAALDDAFAPELLQTWSLPDEDANDSEDDGETDGRIVCVSNPRSLL